MKHIMKLAFIVLTCVITTAQASWPEKEITLIVPYNAGGTTDRIARQVANVMEPILKKPIVVLDVPGGNTMIAIDRMKHMDPNHTFMVTDPAIIAGPATIGKDEYTPNFHPVMMLGTGPIVIIANSQVPKDDFMARVKRKETIQMATAGGAGPKWINQLSSLKVDLIPYSGSNTEMTAMITRQVDYGVISLVSAWSAIVQKQVTPIMVGSTTRSPLLPNVPTYLELGFKGKPNVQWFGVFALNGVNPEVEKRFLNVLEYAAETPTVQKFKDDGMPIRKHTKKETQDLVNKTREEVADQLK
jgi:tripartite-type tricarboxylate transporter receptor subunit TctC